MKHSLRGSASVLACATALSLTTVAPVMAQEDETVEERNVLIVTAQRREQSILDVPLSVSAVSGEEIAERGVDRIADIQFGIPGFWSVELYPGSERLQIRGISQQTGLPTVATYIDELTVSPGAVTAGADIRMIDLERVEVLRGPQPTLYGEGSMGGTVRYITRKPDLDEYDFRFNGKLGTIDEGSTMYRADAAIGVPLVQDVFGFRLAASVEDTGGWIDTPRGDDANGVDATTVRGTFLFEPNDQFTASLLGLFQNTEQDEFGFANDDLVSTKEDAEPVESEYNLANLVMSYDFGNFELLSSTGTLNREGSIVNSFEFAVPLPPPPAGPGLFPTKSVSVSEGDSERFSQEFRITSDLEGPFSYVAGLTYTDDENRNRAAALGGAFPPDTVSTSTATALYGELTYRTGPWELTGGARYFEDERTTTNAPFDQTFDSFNPRVNVAYAVENGLVYFNAAKGFRSGGFNTPGLILPGEETYDPETLWSYELGTKQQFADDAVTVEAAIYYNDYTDIQSILNPTNNRPTIGRTINSGEASGWGADFGLTYIASPEVTLSFAAGYNGVEYDTSSLAVNAGDRLDNVPEWTGSIALDYNRPLDEKKNLIGRVDLGYNSEFTSTLRLIGTLPIVQRSGDPFPEVVTANSRTVINAKLGLEFEKYTISLFGDNLTNDTEAVYAGGVIQTAEGIRPRPRTMGVSLSADF